MTGKTSRSLPEAFKQYIFHIIGIISILGVTLVTRFIVDDYTHLTENESILIELLVVVLAILVLISILILRVGSWFIQIISIKSTIMGEAIGSEIGPFVKKRLTKLDTDLKGILEDDGQDFDSDSARTLAELCFFHAKGQYDGIDSHPPTEYWKKYKTYLDNHAANLKNKSTTQNNGSRILIIEHSELQIDYHNNPKDFEMFVKWHNDNGVDLFWVEPQFAHELLKKHNLQVTDFGIWHDVYSLFFQKTDNLDIIHLSMASNTHRIKYFDSVKSFFNEIKPLLKDQKITLDFSLVPPTLADKWSDYVDCDARLEKEKEFLIDKLTPYKYGNTIFDAASGIGCESIFLKDKGFDVIANEIEPTFSKIGHKRAISKGLEVRRSSYDWRTLSDILTNTTFGAVLVLGNSLCLLLNEGDRKKALAQFFSIIKPGGMLIIDERNFPYMLKNKTSIQEDPIKNFHDTRTIMYCGHSVKGIPYSNLTDQKIPFLIYDAIGVKNLADALKKPIGKFDLYPFAKDELRKLLDETGFNNITVFSDFKEGFDENAEFYTYVAYKPQ